jgi:CDP-paratose 2-epimerase
LRYGDWREGDQRYYVSDARRITDDLGLPAPRGWRSGVADLLDWLARERGMALASFAAAESAR